MLELVIWSVIRSALLGSLLFDLLPSEWIGPAMGHLLYVLSCMVPPLISHFCISLARNLQ